MTFPVAPRPWLLCAALWCILSYAFADKPTLNECPFIEEFIEDSTAAAARVVGGKQLLRVRKWMPGTVLCRAGRSQHIDDRMAWFGPADTAYDYYRNGSRFIASLKTTAELRVLDIMDARNLNILAPVFTTWDSLEEFERISAKAGYAKPSWWKSVLPHVGLKEAFNYTIGEANAQSTLRRNNAMDASRGAAMAVCVFLKYYAPKLHGWYHMAFDYTTKDGKRYTKGAEVLLCDTAKTFGG